MLSEPSMAHTNVLSATDCTDHIFSIILTPVNLFTAITKFIHRLEAEVQSGRFRLSEVALRVVDAIVAHVVARSFRRKVDFFCTKV